MLFALTVLIPATILWYENIKSYKKINLINTVTSSDLKIEDSHETQSNFVTNVNINSLIKDPIVVPYSNLRWIFLRTEEYKRISIKKNNSFHPFRNETRILNMYQKTRYNSIRLKEYQGINVNSIISKLFKKYQIREVPFIIHDNTKTEISKDCDIMCGTIITKKEIGSAYYNTGIDYDRDLRCTIIGKLINNNIDPNNCIVYNQNVIDVDVIRDKYYKKISNNKKWFTFFICASLLFGFIEYKR